MVCEEPSSEALSLRRHLLYVLVLSRCIIWNGWGDYLRKERFNQYFGNSKKTGRNVT